MTDGDNPQGPPLYGDVKRTNAEHQAAYRRRKPWRDAMAQAERKDDPRSNDQQSPSP